MKRNMHKKAITIIEMLIVVGIIVILAAIVMQVGGGLDKQAKEQLTRATISTLQGALEEYHNFYDEFPEPYAIVPSLPDEPAFRSEVMYHELYSVPSSRKMLAEINDSLFRDKIIVDANNPAPEVYDPWDNAIDYQYVRVLHMFPEVRSAGQDGVYGTPDDITNLD